MVQFSKMIQVFCVCFFVDVQLFKSEGGGKIPDFTNWVAKTVEMTSDQNLHEEI